MEAKVTLTVASKGGGDAGPLFDKEKMTRIGQAVAAAIALRTDAGKSADGEKNFDAYSRDKAWISKEARPAPKGGDGRSKSGRSVIYEGGYRQYKGDSTGSDRPNLTASGEMLQSYGVVDADDSSVEIGPSKAMAGRALGNNKLRPWMGHTKTSTAALEDEVQDILDESDLLAGRAKGSSIAKVVT